jgi:hypothetical protein
LWTHQLGTSESDCGSGVAVDGSGNAYITGFTGGTLDGNAKGVTAMPPAKVNGVSR